MKHFVLSFFILFTLTATAQTKPPTMAKLMQLYVDSNKAAINDYAHLLGFKGEPLGIPMIGNTYDYNHYIFAYKDTAKKQNTYLGYTWGQHHPMFSYRLVKVEYSTDSQIEFDTLIKELLGLGGILDTTIDATPGWAIYTYREQSITTHISHTPNTAKYNITVGGRYW